MQGILGHIETSLNDLRVLANLSVTTLLFCFAFCNVKLISNQKERL